MGSFHAYPAVRFDECNVACWMSLGPCLLIVINERGLVARPDFAESVAGLSGGSFWLRSLREPIKPGRICLEGLILARAEDPRRGLSHWKVSNRQASCGAGRKGTVVLVILVALEVRYLTLRYLGTYGSLGMI
jgi:hypothetical protein